jgi:hypothetical protein
VTPDNMTDAARSAVSEVRVHIVKTHSGPELLCVCLRTEAELEMGEHATEISSGALHFEAATSGVFIRHRCCYIHKGMISRAWIAQSV